MKPITAEIGIFGGSGFYEWLDAGDEVEIATPYGPPSGSIALAEVGGRSVAFLPRHGPNHEVSAPFVNYRANVWAMHEIGVRRIIGPSAVGSLKPNLHPGDLVISDQFFDRTSGRADTYYPGPDVVHVSAADPYCPELRELAGRIAEQQSMRFSPSGTVVVVQGPRFSTRAESRWFSRMGWDIVGMTQYPEVMLARGNESTLIRGSTEVTQLTANNLRDLFATARKKRALGERVLINSSEVME